MDVINMHDAKSRLSALVEAVESGRESEIILARHGKPAARIVPLATRQPIRLGLAEGKYPSLSLEDINRDDDEIAAAFNDGPIWPDETGR